MIAYYFKVDKRNRIILLQESPPSSILIQGRKKTQLKKYDTPARGWVQRA